MAPSATLVSRMKVDSVQHINQSSTSATISNASALLFTNSTSVDPANFSYIIPYGQSQECDIYGPVCQTGSITVGVNLTTATASTVLPCSSYLTAQSSYLENFGFFDTPEDWQLNFGRSPECRSYAEGFINGQYAITGCGDQNTVIQTADGWDIPDDGPNFSPQQLPPGILEFYSDYYTGWCCGNCSLVVSEVRLYYFPDSTTPTCQSNQTSNSTSILSARAREKREHSAVGDGSIAVFSGQTFTSPSVYLQIVGTAAVSDGCGAIGSTLTDPIITFPPGGLSTWKPPSASYQEEYGMSYAIGDEWEDPIAVAGLGMVGELAPLTIKDLACPSWGLGRSTSADGTVITTIGAPWLPVIAPPMEAFSLNPIWALLCTGILTEQTGDNTFALYDPPIALTPGLGLVPAPVVPVITPTSVPAPNYADPTTVPDIIVPPSAAAAKPASSPVDPAGPPARTGNPMGDSPSPSLAVASADPARPGSPPDVAAASPTNRGDSPADPKVPQPIASAVSVVGAKYPPADPIIPSSDGPDPHGDPQTASTDPNIPAQPAPEQGDVSQPQTQGLGAIIYNAFGNSGPDIGGTANEVSTISVPSAGIQVVSVAGGQLAVDPSGVQFEGKTYSVGGPAMTISNNVYTLVAQQGSDNSATNDHETPNDSLPPAPDTLTIAGHVVVPNPTGMIVAGSSVLPGGSAITISNILISLDPSGILVVGPSSFSLPPRSIFIVGDQPFTANPTGFVLDGATISPGAAAQTLDGTIISLGQSGKLVVGSTTISLATPPTTPSPASSFTVAGQTFTPNPTAFSIAGTTISAGGSPVTLAGTIISLGQLGALIIGSSTVSLLTPLPIPPFTVAGQTFTPNPSAFSIDGTTISAGGPAITLAGTVISLQPSGTLVVGTTTIPLLAPQTPFPPLLNIDGLSVEAQPSFAIVDGVTIRPGASGVTVDGQNVSLEPGGATLDVGTGRFAMPTAVSNGSAGLLAFEGGQGKGAQVSLVLLLGFGFAGSFMLAV